LEEPEPLSHCYWLGRRQANGQKYWIIRNSYGPSWGEGGDFMVRRGADDMGIESEQVAFEPELLI